MTPRRWGWMLCFTAATTLLGPPAQAAESSTGYMAGATRKLGRGICNMATGPLELIRTPSLVNQQDGGLAGATIGVVQGVWAMASREVVGVYEVATFLIPLPKGFRPIMTPEFVYAGGDWSP